MGDNGSLLEIRLFKLQPGTREEFDRVSREGTVPMMRRLGITVVAHGPSLNNEDGYFLLRMFGSEKERVELSQQLYVTDEWLEKYDAPVTAMIADYQTAVMPAPRLADQLASLAGLAVSGGAGGLAGAAPVQ